MSRVVPVVALGEDLDGFLQGLLHARLHDLLTLSLHDVLRVVLAHLLVGGGCEANHRGGTSMADINANEHSPHLLHHLGELQVEEVTFDLGVDLAEDVASLAHVEGASVASGHDLGRDLELLEQFLVHAVVVFVAEDYEDDLGVAEDTVRPSHHVLKQLVLDLAVVVLLLQLDEVGLLHLDLQHATGLAERVVDVVGDIEVGALSWARLLRVLVDHDPLILQQVDCLLNRKPLQCLLATLNDLAISEQLHLRGAEDEAVEGDGNLLDLQAPVFHGILLGEQVYHLLDLPNLLLRGDASHCKGVSHPSSLPDGVGDAIEETEFRG